MADNTNDSLQNLQSSSLSAEELQEIENDLRQVEDGLRTSRRPRGRAFFDSVDTMLGSLRSRLQDVHTHASSLSISRRLDTAELAHSSRIPLNLLRSNSNLRERQSSRGSLLQSITSRSEKGEASEDSGMTLSSSSSPLEEAASALPQDASSQQQVTSPTLQLFRSSSLVASRRQEESVNHAVDMDVHEDGTQAILSTLQEKDGDDSDFAISSAEFDDEDMLISSHEDALKESETPVLLSELSRHRATSFVRSVSGTITLPKPDDRGEGADSDGYAVYSWGPQGSYSLHDDGEARTSMNSEVSSNSRIGRLAGLISVACGPTHAACVTTSGGVFTCGDNSSGAVDPSRRDVKEIVRPSLLEILGNAVIKQVSCGGSHTAALTSAGTVLTWGSNDVDQLGHYRPTIVDPTTFCGPKIMVLGQGTRAANVACGSKFTMVLTTRMSVLVCGDPLIAGYANSEKVNRRLPNQLPALVGLPLVSVAAGKDHAVVLTSHGSAYVWGNNASSCCGRSVPKELSLPVPIVAPKSHLDTPLGVISIPDWATNHHQQGAGGLLPDDVSIVHAACGDGHTVLVTRTGRLLVCGLNDHGQLGVLVDDGALVVEHVKAVNHPERGRHFVSAEAGEKHTLLLDDVGDAWEMGGLAGPVGGSDNLLRRVLARKNIVTIAAGGTNSIAVAMDGATTCQFSMTQDETTAASSGSKLAHDLDSLIKYVSEEMETDEPSLSSAGQELVNRTEELLKYPAVVNSLFLDPIELDQLYVEISNVGNVTLRKALAVAMEKSIQFGLESLRSLDARMIYPEAVMFLLHYLRFFERDENSASVFDVRGSCIVSLCEAMLSLPYEGFRALIAWMGLYPRELFVRMLLKPLLYQLSMALRVDVDENGVQHTKPSRRAAPVIVAILRWLHRASERARNARPEDFYCEAIGKIPLEILYEDLRMLKSTSKNQRSNSFLISESPFLIPPSTKRDLLQIESNVNMMKIATQDARYNVADGTMEVQPFFVLEIEREHMLEQTLEIIKKASPWDLRKKLRVKFKGEDGVDAGGVTKEFFQLVSEELFDISSGMWTRRYGDHITWFNSDCTWDDQGYEMVGVIVGLALYNGVLVDVHFPPAVYRKLLELPLGLEDLVDPEIKKGLQELLEYEGDVDCLCLSFEVTWMDLGKEQTVQLKPGGSDIAVTSSNKEEYVLLYVKWLLVDSIQPQWFSFRLGLMRIMESSSLDLFRPEELELFLVGSPELDFAALESNAEYEGGFDKSSAVIQNLWRFVKNADHETQMQFLKFATGSSNAPIGGLGALPFKIQRAGPDSQQLPTSHTCFNTLLLPDYGDNYDKLAERLGRAVLECEGFGLA